MAITYIWWGHLRSRASCFSGRTGDKDDIRGGINIVHVRKTVDDSAAYQMATRRCCNIHKPLQHQLIPQVSPAPEDEVKMLQRFVRNILKNIAKNPKHVLKTVYDSTAIFNPPTEYRP